MARFYARAILLGVGLLFTVASMLFWLAWRQQLQSVDDREFRIDPLEETAEMMAIRRGLHPFIEPPLKSSKLNRTEVRPSSDCRWVKPWFLDHTWPDTHLVFYAKPIMQVVKSICVQRRWRLKLILNDSSYGLAELERSLQPHIFTIAFTSSRALRHTLIQRLANSTSALVSGIRYAYKITGAKKGQLDAFRAHFRMFGCTLEDANIMPRSFLLDDSSECIQFFRYANTRPSSPWVLKTSQGYGGDGITILPNVTSLYKDFGTCDRTEEYIAQEYLPNLLLLEGRKFDVRALVLIAGTNPYYLFHHEGYLRVSVKEFDPHGGRAVHLTNSHVQTISEGFAPEKHFWSFQRFQQYLDLYYPENEDFLESKLVPFIKKISLFILQTGLNIFERMPSSFQLLGLDFMVTRDFRVWFIEANNYPLWPKGISYIDELMNTMGNDMFDLLFDMRKHPERFAHMRAGEWFKSWQLIWSEVDATCSNTPPYNPCREFLSY